MNAVEVGGTVVDAEERVPSAKSAVLRSTNPRSMAQRNAASRSATPRNVATRSVKNRSDSALRVLRKKELHVGTEYMQGRRSTVVAAKPKARAVSGQLTVGWLHMHMYV